MRQTPADHRGKWGRRTRRIEVRVLDDGTERRAFFAELALPLGRYARNSSDERSGTQRRGGVTCELDLLARLHDQDRHRGTRHMDRAILVAVGESG
jgi:hypothetical protein